jgi:hypothetical protein
MLARIPQIYQLFMNRDFIYDFHSKIPELCYKFIISPTLSLYPEVCSQDMNVFLEVTVFWDVTLCSLAEFY